jgi:hypothetical protein
MNRWWPVLLPELRRFPAEEQDEVLREARATGLDLPELLGMAAALVLVSALTRYSLPDTDISTRLGAALLNIVVAAPLLVLLVGPFFVRRARRGLDRELAKRRLQ